MHWIREIGIYDCIHRRWYPRKPPCEGGIGFNSIGLTEVRPALMLLLFGFGAASVVLLLEILHTFLQKKCNRNIALVKRRLSKNSRLKLFN